MSPAGPYPEAVESIVAFFARWEMERVESLTTPLDAYSPDQASREEV